MKALWFSVVVMPRPKRRNPASPEQRTISMNARDVRASNLASVFSAIATHPTALSRADIADEVGLTRSTVSRLVDSLLSSGIIMELNAPNNGTPGRPATPLIIRPGAVFTIGLEANVSYLTALAMDLTGEVLFQEARTGDFRHSEPKAVLTKLGAMGSAMVNRLRSSAISFGGTALALPGIVVGDTLYKAPNLGWEHVTPAPLLDPGGELGDIQVGNEATFASWSAARLSPGVPNGPENFLYISGDVGVGGCIVAHSRPSIGRQGWGGEIGHVCVDPAGPTCSCGSTGCLEAFVGHRALARTLHLPSSTTAAGMLSSQPLPELIRTLSLAGRALGRAIADIANLLVIHDVIFGGELATLLPALEPSARIELDQRVLGPRRVRFITSPDASERWAASRGGAISLLEPLLDNPDKHINV